MTGLQRRIKWMENYYHGANINEVELKAELAGLPEEDAKTDKLRRLALYSCRLLAGNSYVCSKCYDKGLQKYYRKQRSILRLYMFL
jgi:hypothetical protein